MMNPAEADPERNRMSFGAVGDSPQLHLFFSCTGEQSVIP